MNPPSILARIPGNTAPITKPMTGQCFYRNRHNRKYIPIGRTGILTSFMTNLDGDKVGALCQWIRHPARLETRVEY